MDTLLVAKDSSLYDMIMLFAEKQCYIAMVTSVERKNYIKDKDKYLF